MGSEQTQDLTTDGSGTKRPFFGWWIVATSVLTFGLSVGVPYYNLPFFYDYFEKAHRWGLGQITLGLPLGVLLTIWIGPLLIPKFSPRKLIFFGAGLTAISLVGFGQMHDSVFYFYGLCFIFMVGIIASGPIPHQIIVSYWFRKQRGRAMGVVYAGVGLFGGLGSLSVLWLTNAFGFRVALAVLGALMLLVWPLSLYFLKDRPAELGQFPDGDSQNPDEARRVSMSSSHLLRTGSFWLLVLASMCSVGAIGAINVHIKFVFRDAGFIGQDGLNSAWTRASALILWSSIAGRLVVGYFADVYSKKRVMAITYVLVAASILLLIEVSPTRPASLYVFAIGFGFSMGADYMLIPLMAAEQFGINSLAQAMSIILPLNLLGQTWVPFMVSALREHFGNYHVAMTAILLLSVVGAVAVVMLPRPSLVRDGVVV